MPAAPWACATSPQKNTSSQEPDRFASESRLFPLNIGLLGGSFDPVHKGHLALARAALKQLKLSKVYFVLSPHSPFKTNQRQTPVAMRLRLLKVALKNQSSLAIGRWELKRKGPSYTVDTLRALKKKNSRHHLFWIMGSDSWTDFKKWKNPSEIERLATLVIGRRPGFKKTAPPPPLAQAIFLKGLFPLISSTVIRKQFSLAPKRSSMVPPAVNTLIKKLRLYDR